MLLLVFAFILLFFINFSFVFLYLYSEEKVTEKYSLKTNFLKPSAFFNEEQNFEHGPVLLQKIETGLFD